MQYRLPIKSLIFILNNLFFCLSITSSVLINHPMYFFIQIYSWLAKGSFPLFDSVYFLRIVHYQFLLHVFTYTGRFTTDDTKQWPLRQGQVEEREDLDKEHQIQKNGSPPHIDNVTMTWLREKFRVPHQPDLNPPSDFFFWAFLMYNIYQRNLRTIASLRAANTQKIEAITQDECACAIYNFAFNKIFE